MVHWTEEYSTALAVRDETEKANIPLYNAYTRLADRTSRMTTTTNPPLDNVSAEKDKDKEKEKGQHAASPKLPTKTQQQGEVDDILAATRADFAEAQRSRTELQNRLDQVGAELEKLRRRSGQSQRRISSLDSERMQLNLRLRDREEELRGKAKLLDDFQDELATLNLQLNMAEDRSSRLQRENKELVDRWMARVGKEADAMNDRYEFS